WFAPTLTRASVHWDVESDVALGAPAVVSAAERAGWHVDAAGADSLRASRGRMRLDDDLVAGVRVSVVVERGPAVPSMTTTVTGGALLGAFLAVLVVRGPVGHRGCGHVAGPGCHGLRPDPRRPAGFPSAGVPRTRRSAS